MPNKKKNGQKVFGPSEIKVQSQLFERTRERGERGRYTSNLDEISLSKDLTDDLMDYTGTGSFMREGNKERGERGRYTSLYKGVNKNEKGQFTYDVTREGGLFGNTSRSRVISEKAAKRKMRRLEKKYDRNVKRQARKSKRFGI